MEVEDLRVEVKGRGFGGFDGGEVRIGDPFVIGEGCFVEVDPLRQERGEGLRQERILEGSGDPLLTKGGGEWDVEGDAIVDVFLEEEGGVLKPMGWVGCGVDEGMDFFECMSWGVLDEVGEVIGEGGDVLRAKG